MSINELYRFWLVDFMTFRQSCVFLFTVFVLSLLTAAPDRLEYGIDLLI